MPDLNPKQFVQQSWYHAGRPDFLDNPMYVHIGSRQAAEQRVDPSRWDQGDPDSFLRMRRNSGLYEVRLDPRATVFPEVESDEDISYRFAPTKRYTEALGRAGVKRWNEEETVVSGDYDAYPYVNEYEAEGSISLLANPEKLKITRRLR